MAAGKPKAHSGNIVQIDEGDLHQIMDECERALDVAETQLPELSGKLDQESQKWAGEIAELRGILTELRDGYRTLDSKTDHDDKLWRAETPFHTRAYRSMGDVFTASYAGFKSGYRNLPEGFKRAADQTGDNDTKGGVLVPDITYDQIGYILGEKSLARLLCTVIPMVSDNMKAPVLDTGPLAYYIGTQGAEVPDTSKLEFSKKDLDVKTLMAINIVSGELAEDSLPAYGPFWAQVFMDAFALKETKAVFSENPNDAGSAFTGIVQAVAAATGDTKHQLYLGNAANSGKTHFSQVMFKDIINLAAGPNENALDFACYVMNKAAWAQILGVTDGQGMPIFSTIYQNLMVNVGGPRPDPKMARSTILNGDPCYITRAMPSDIGTAGKAMIVYGNPKYHFFGDRRQMAIAWSDEAAFTTGARVMRCRERYASTTIMPDAFATLAPASS